MKKLKLKKGHLLIIYLFSMFALLGVLFWTISYAYDPANPEWKSWVVPLQQTIFLVIMGINIITVFVLVLPNDWFMRLLDKEKNINE